MMPRKRSTPPRDAAQLKRDTGRLYAQKGAAMRDLKTLEQLSRPKPASRSRRQQTKPQSRGIHMGPE